MSNDEHRTQDMSLVAYLKGMEIPYDRMELNGDQVTWVFEKTERFSDELDAFVTGEAVVDPKQYTRDVARIRERLFQFREREQQQASSAS